MGAVGAPRAISLIGSTLPPSAAGRTVGAMRTRRYSIERAAAANATLIPVACGALAVAAVAAVVVDALAPGAGPLVQPLSSFAHSTYAWLWDLSVGAAAAGVLLVALALRPPAASRSFSALLAIAAAGLATAGVFTTDAWFPWERTPTLRGAAHVAGVLVVVAAFAVAMGRRASGMRSRRWRGAQRACEVTYGASLAGAFIYVAVTAAAGRPPLLVGLWERLLLGSALAWCGLLASAA